jgi:hypothetical protein
MSKTSLLPMGRTFLASFEISDVLVPKLTSATVCTPVRNVTVEGELRLEAAVKG